MKEFIKKGGFLILVLIGANGCNKSMQTEMTYALSVLDSARVEGTNIIYGSEFKQLEDSVLMIIEVVEIEKSNLIIKNHDNDLATLQKLVAEINSLRHKHVQDPLPDEGDKLIEE